ncbi:DUF1290 domain-containing protein [Kamptonema cortianum]|nr:DUF1290 domain-containing protein [Geitlerinema splendidum]MDK3158827.1 DUF1290 domain-containing protein [Kamptonema cortianum]
MIFIPILALVVGILLGLVIRYPLPPELAPYLSIAVLAGLDSLIGGMRSHTESKYQTDIFLTGFLFNILVATFFVWLGVQIQLNLMLAAALVFGTRIFLNLSLIRRWFLTRITDRKARLKVEENLASRQNLSADEPVNTLDDGQISPEQATVKESVSKTTGN